MGKARRGYRAAMLSAVCPARPNSRQQSSKSAAIFSGIGRVDALVEHPLAVVRVERLHADLDVQRAPPALQTARAAREAFLRNSQWLSMCRSRTPFSRQMRSTSRMVDSSSSANEPELIASRRPYTPVTCASTCTVEGEVCLLVARCVQMVVAEACSASTRSPARAAAQFRADFCPQSPNSGSVSTGFPSVWQKNKAYPKRYTILWPAPSRRAVQQKICIFAQHANFHQKSGHVPDF